ncbi:type I glyceraldehyde-3-phosphate dehydrogenase [Peptoniphilus sp. GNH]|nr:glyceraldehyde-3-phosphate dehydrogenase, type I [Clostridiales bacterium KA00134]UHR02415.1 type I glyceraldehyde-3-phosphate dehydrogenase [Peptoniphilus sp. GNH]
MIKVGLMGFGRIGRDFVRSYFLRKRKEDLGFKLVNINASTAPEVMAKLLKRDSIYRLFDGEISYGQDYLEVDGEKVYITAERDPKKAPWKDLGLDIIVDSTGAFKEREKANWHLQSGAKKVILTSPGKDEDITIVMGVNDCLYDKDKHNIISNASCTTNCLAPIAKVILDKFGIEKAFMTTIHAYTGDQNILDNRHKKGDMRRARAGAENIVPTSTGAAKAVGLVIPELKGKFHGISMRVPIPVGSLVDATFILPKEVTKDEVNQAVKEAAEGPMKGILEYSEEELVSSDIIGNPHASIFDSLLTTVDKNVIKLVSWYDNEWGYTQRVVDLTSKIAKEI